MLGMPGLGKTNILENLQKQYAALPLNKIEKQVVALQKELIDLGLPK